MDEERGRKLTGVLSEVRYGEATALDLIELRDAAGAEVGKQLVVTAKKDSPRRAESGPRNHEVFDAAGLVEYVRRHGSKDSVVFVDPTKSTIEVALNEVAERGVEVVTMRPAVHPRWKPWRDLLGKTLKLGDFVEFLRNNRRAVVTPDGREVLALLGQVRASTSITLHQGRGNAALNGLLIQTKIGGGSKEDVIDLPDKIVVRSPIFAAGEERETEIDLLIEGSSDGASVFVKLASADIQEAEIAAFAEHTDTALTLATDPGCVVLHGRHERGSWAYER